MKNTLVLLLTLLTLCTSYAQKKVVSAIKRADPPHWWTGMRNPDVQLMLYGQNINGFAWTVNYPGVTLEHVTRAENPAFVFLDLRIAATAKPGTLQITGVSGKYKVTYPYVLKERTAEKKGTGVTAADLIYLIMPDRFANGDKTNDKFATMQDTQADRANPFLRHGGDLKGIEAHLDYLKALGVTALWLTPVLDNDEKLKKEGHGKLQAGYHGYHFTDHYKIDKRFGGNDGYKAFAKAVHQQGFKLVQDAVYNHVSDDHWFFKDAPYKSWFNAWPAYTESSHKEQVLFDPYSSDLDRRVLIDGWFTPFLPDLNLRDPFLANYLIQHAIWSTEEFSLDAWRIDTYKYNDQQFMNRCNDALVAEYPSIHLFGETVSGNPLALSYFVKSNVDFTMKSTLPGTLDFPLNYAINDALTQNYGWDNGVNRLHQTLAQDIVYRDPLKMVTQLDNHDMNRFVSVIGDDLGKFKMGVAWLLTMRGIPTWYYGTEILMKNFKDPTDAEVRQDFPGGFEGDAANKFTAQGRTPRENDAFNFVTTLANYRKQTPALHSGKTMQYVPANGVYVYFRYDESRTIMIITNSNDQEATLSPARFEERIGKNTGGLNVLTGERNLLNNLKLPAKTALVLELY